MLIDSGNYHLFGQFDLPDTFILQDHHNGYDKNLRNVLFDKIKSRQHTIITHTVIDEQVKKNYPHLHFKFSADMQDKLNLGHFKNYKKHPRINYKNFICSFNGSVHVSRQLLSSILENQGLFNSDYSSKNFKASNDKILGHLNNLDLTEDEIELYDKFFKNTDEFNDTVYSFGHVRFDHGNNIYNLESKLTQSFVHIVSETMATSYYPFVTEKFLYSIVTRGLFVAYAQPGWHAHLEKYYGFKLYDKIFDYSFDSIQNPVKRLIKLIEMISKFSTLSVDDWRDLYFVLEKDTIEYNYNHYFSGDYIKWLKEYE
jgi:hypothetical protein